jgi:hypothetical protein
MPSEKLTNGDPIQARCTKCRKITSHTIVAMGPEYPTEVQCKRCQHTAPARKPIDRRSVDPQKAKREEWAALRPGMDSSRAADYSMTASFKVKSLVNHSLFGLGLVQRMSGLQKMVVLFADGEKVMRCK